MLNWEDFESLRVIKKLRTIIGHWWNAEIIFADENGNVKNMERNSMPNFDNKIFSMIMKSPRGLDLLTNVCRAVVSQAKTDKKFYHTWSDTGLSCFVVPIFLDNSFSGIVLATSFFTEKTSEKDKEKLY
ncbi:MAG: hypothetical protein NTY22_09210, partial [Proteobacteria bacterium]|nr:hypothetical protein [Pseudomonadota bacterium]